jgi:uncharacterized membrane-anchored protein
MPSLPPATRREWLNKVPHATLLFWIIKMMSTTVGETGADYLNADLHFGLGGTTAVVGLLLALCLWMQMRASRYIPVLYWLVVVCISVFGTLLTDNLSDQLGVPLAVSTGAFSAALALTFIFWYRRERTLSIDSIVTPRREWFYWSAILFTFALGTAAGDWVAEGMQLGYAYAALLFGVLIATTAIAHYLFKLNTVACFWIAYVLTRPFGAACGDLLSQPAANGGLGYGTINTSILFLVTIVALVTYLSAMQKNVVPLKVDV